MSWALLWRLARTSIPVPLAALLMLWGLWQWDRFSAVRRAVGEYAAAEQLAEERARAGAAEAVSAELARQRDALQTANQQFQLDAGRTQQHLAVLEREINEIAARPIDRSCSVDRRILERLRSR